MSATIRKKILGVCNYYESHSGATRGARPNEVAEAVGETNSIRRMANGELQAVRPNRGDRFDMISKLFLSLCLMVGLSAVMATNAQIESDATIYANIPHSFIVRDTTLPAGEYMIKVADDYNDLNVLEIRSRQGHATVLV